MKERNISVYKLVTCRQKDFKSLPATAYCFHLLDYSGLQIQRRGNIPSTHSIPGNEGFSENRGSVHKFKDVLYDFSNLAVLL